MVRLKVGDMFKSNCHALVCPVNTEGVAGAGLALHFKKHFEHNYAEYVKACKRGALAIGKVFAVRDSCAKYGDKVIVNFATKTHWSEPSRLEYIEAGLDDLRRVAEQQGIKRVALPLLGCGLGRLNRCDVINLVIRQLDSSPVEFHLYVV